MYACNSCELDRDQRTFRLYTVRIACVRVLARIGIGRGGRQDSGRFVSGVPRARRAKSLFFFYVAHSVQIRLQYTINTRLAVNIISLETRYTIFPFVTN